MQDVVVVTGGSAGIGAAIAEEFAARGFSICLVSRSQERLEATADALRRRHRVPVCHVAVDLAQPDAIEGLAQALRSQGMRVRTLVNCAGWGRIGPFIGNDSHAAADMIDLNCRALTQACHRFLPEIIASGGGILNVASVAGFLPGPGMSVYFASKAYVVSLTRSLAHELAGQGVTVSALCPGPSPTRFQARAGMHPGRSRPLLTLEPDAIARIGVAGHLAGKVVIIPGFWNKALAFCGKFVVHPLLMPFVSRYHRLERGRGLRGGAAAVMRVEAAVQPVRTRPDNGP